MLAALSTSCAVDGEAEALIAMHAQAIVYGEDDRVELYQADAGLSRLARATAVALMSPNALQPQGDGSYRVVARSYGEVQGLCPGERFAEQPAAASCSGVLVAPDLVATAGHCLGVGSDGGPDCTVYRYVLGFSISDPSAPLAVAASDVFECTEVLARVKTPPDAGCHFDFGLVRLSRSAPEAVPFRTRPLEAGEPLAVIGFPAGLPVKIDRGARVVDLRPAQGDFFTLTSDTFAVSSGSGVFDGAGNLVGLFSRGRRDYDQDGGCSRVHRDEEIDAAGYEEAAYVAGIRELLNTAEQTDDAPVAPDQFCHVLEYLERPPTATADSGANVESRRGDGCSISFVDRGEGAHPACLSCALMLAVLALRQRLRRGRLLDLSSPSTGATRRPSRARLHPYQAAARSRAHPLALTRPSRQVL